MGKKLSGKKNLGKKKFSVKKKLASKNFWVRKIFCLKKTGRVNPRGRIYDSPHQKIVGLKFCWVVLSCPKRFFVKKKNIGRVNPALLQS